MVFLNFGCGVVQNMDLLIEINLVLAHQLENENPLQFNYQVLLGKKNFIILLQRGGLRFWLKLMGHYGHSGKVKIGDN